MNDRPQTRHIHLESVHNFRDLGGYRTRDGRKVIWRKLFRSAELRHMNERDLAVLKEEIGLISIIDLRSETELVQQGIGLLNGCGLQYHSVPFIINEEERNNGIERFRSFSSMGEVYLYFIRHPEYGRHIVEALEIMAHPEKYPLVFHCAAGKDRTGILAAMVLSVLGVADEDIIEDYSLTAPYMKELLARLDRDPRLSAEIRELPGYMWEAAGESMAMFLSALRSEYGSARQYLEASGARASLFDRLERTLLV